MKALERGMLGAATELDLEPAGGWRSIEGDEVRLAAVEEPWGFTTQSLLKVSAVISDMDSEGRDDQLSSSPGPLPLRTEETCILPTDVGEQEVRQTLKMSSFNVANI